MANPSRMSPLLSSKCRTTKILAASRSFGGERLISLWAEVNALRDLRRSAKPEARPKLASPYSDVGDLSKVVLTKAIARNSFLVNQTHTPTNAYLVSLS